HVGQHLAVDLDPGLAQAVHQSRVGQTVLASAGSDPGDPQSSELRLAVSPIAVGVLSRVEELFLGHAVALRSRSEVPLRLAEHLTALLLRVNRSFDPCHLSLLPEEPTDVGALGRDLGHALHAASTAPALLPQEMVAGRLAMEDLAGPRDAEPLGRRSVRLLFGHRSSSSGRTCAACDSSHVSCYVSGGASAGAATTSSGACSGTGSARGTAASGSRRFLGSVLFGSGGLFDGART